MVTAGEEHVIQHSSLSEDKVQLMLRSVISPGHSGEILVAKVVVMHQFFVGAELEQLLAVLIELANPKMPNATWPRSCDLHPPGC